MWSSRVVRHSSVTVRCWATSRSQTAQRWCRVERQGPPGILATGDLEFQFASFYAPQLAGSVAGVDYDQVSVTGTVSLSGGILLEGNDGVFPGANYRIIDNDGSDPVVGTFVGLPEGAVFEEGGTTFQITYEGGTGNDVVLTALGNELVVSNTNDTGEGTLRAAILAANAISGPNTIVFDITMNEGAGPHVIRPVTPLPEITDGVTIDGYSENGATQNTLAIGSNANLQVVLDGSLLTGEDGLRFTAGQGNPSSVEGLVIHGFRDGIVVDDVADGIGIFGNYIGTDLTGMSAVGNTERGVWITEASDGVDVGSANFGDRNVISGNASHGILVDASSTSV